LTSKAALAKAALAKAALTSGTSSYVEHAHSGVLNPLRTNVKYIPFDPKQQSAERVTMIGNLINILLAFDTVGSAAQTTCSSEQASGGR
jgi:hypothetical protein